MIIRTEALTKLFRTDEVETTALDAVNLSVGEGEFTSIMGPSGCGKSTLLHILGLIDNADGGKYWFLDEDVSSYSERQRANLRKENIGFVFQDFNLIPVLTDSELENILTSALEAGAGWAGYVLLRLPHELKEMFQQWLDEHEPLKAQHIMNRVRDCREGKEYQAEFGTRMTGKGIFAELIKKRYQLAMKQLQFPGLGELDTSHFKVPQKSGDQMALF